MAEPNYRRVLEDLRRRIANGEWSSGDRKLPTTVELVEHYQRVLAWPLLSRTTVRRAVEILIESGELEGRQGIGVFVPPSV
jgi:GntR family transcriptional regulator